MDQAEAQSNKTKILIVEDSRSIHTELKRQIINHFDFEVHAVESYDEAKKALSDFAPEIFPAITDLNLPDAPRGEAVDLIRSKAVPCMVFTSDVSDTTRKRMLGK